MAMATPNRNYKLKKKENYLLIPVFNSTTSDLQSTENQIFYFKYSFFCHFAAPWTLLPKTATPMTPPPQAKPTSHPTLS
jgi:hypothetical protein